MGLVSYYRELPYLIQQGLLWVNRVRNTGSREWHVVRARYIGYSLVKISNNILKQQDSVLSVAGFLNLSNGW